MIAKLITSTSILMVLSSSLVAAMAQMSDAVLEEKCVSVSLNNPLPEGFSEDLVRKVCACIASETSSNQEARAAFEAGLEIADFEDRTEAVGEIGQAVLATCLTEE